MGELRELLNQQEDLFVERNAAKYGHYDNPRHGCPNCRRFRVMEGKDGKHRCEKCAWCIEDNDYDSDFAAYLR